MFNRFEFSFLSLVLVISRLKSTHCHKQPCSSFELGSPGLFPTTINITTHTHTYTCSKKLQTHLSFIIIHYYGLLLLRPCFWYFPNSDLLLFPSLFPFHCLLSLYISLFDHLLRPCFWYFPLYFSPIPTSSYSCLFFCSIAHSLSIYLSVSISSSYLYFFLYYSSCLPLFSLLLHPFVSFLSIVQVSFLFTVLFLLSPFYSPYFLLFFSTPSR